MAERKKKGKQSIAQQADLHEYYEKAVQCAESECEFVVDTFRQIRGRTPHSLREDFCGTASVACQWVSLGRSMHATGVDLDAAVLDWGRGRNVARLKPSQQARLQLLQADVTKVRATGFDAVAAFNFSYWIFKTRAQMLQYFRRVRRSLVKDGIFFLDAYGGYDAYRELRETTAHRGFTYVWHQEKYYPVTSEVLCHIGFRFSDGSRIDKAFTYDWRLWSLPELTELLSEAGFSKTTVWWEGTARDGRGNGEFTPEAKGDADAGWVAYLVAEY